VFRNDDALIMQTVEEREALFLKLGCADGIHSTSMA
jgi:hypothetical protein